jgi:hypothetical protein
MGNSGGSSEDQSVDRNADSRDYVHDVSGENKDSMRN